MIIASRFRSAAAVLAMGMAILYVISPFVSLWRLQGAAEHNDWATLEELIDFPAVRSSLKQQALGEFRERAAGTLRNRFVAGWVTRALGPEVVNRIIDSHCTPAGIAQRIKGEKIEHAYFSGWSEFTFQTRSLKGAARFTGLGWQVFWVELPGQW